MLLFLEFLSGFLLEALWSLRLPCRPRPCCGLARPPRCVAHAGRGLAPHLARDGGVGPHPALYPAPWWALHGSSISGHLSVKTLNCFQLHRRDKGEWVRPSSRQERRQAFISTATRSDLGSWKGQAAGEESASLPLQVNRPARDPLREEGTSDSLELLFQKLFLPLLEERLSLRSFVFVFFFF